MKTEEARSIPAEEFARDVRAGLTRPGQKGLPSKYFYDEVGSALFEVISVLPEYGLTRADERLLRRHSESIAAAIRTPAIVAELGCGTGKKTRWILEALSDRQSTTYYPIEISRAALARCKLELGRIDSVSVVGFEREYLDGLRAVESHRRSDEHLLVLFLGSTIGNFDPPAAVEFLGKVRETMAPGDYLLLGTDLQKPVSRMLAAYDDPTGVTAAFNLNLLARINRELDADFDLSQFRHLARYDHEHSRVEMHLLSLQDQTVTVARAALTATLVKGETIWTESSHKYTTEQVFELAQRTGFACTQQWVDSEWPFAQNLLTAL